MRCAKVVKAFDNTSFVLMTFGTKVRRNGCSLQITDFAQHLWPLLEDTLYCCHFARSSPLS